jgi:hypothetical protein
MAYDTGRSTVCWAHVLGPCHYRDSYFGVQGGHPGRNDYTDEFSDSVVVILGPALSACIAANPHGSIEKQLKTKNGTST